VQPTARNRQLNQAMGVMRRIGTGLIAERKVEAKSVSAHTVFKDETADILRRLEAAQGEKFAGMRARDILSLLVRANTAADARQRLSDEAVLARAPAPSLVRRLC
jgi:hypothetical protein